MLRLVCGLRLAKKNRAAAAKLLDKRLGMSDNRCIKWRGKSLGLLQALMPLQECARDKRQKRKRELMVELKSVCKSFGSVQALKNISISAGSGRAYGLLGRNGAGKTTTLRIIMDIFKPDRGTVLIDGKPAGKSNARIGYLPEERGLYPRRLVGEQMVYIGVLRGLSKETAQRNAKRLLKELEVPEYYQRKLETLSKGNQQKIQLAVALISEPDLLILDEPFSGLDPVNAKILKDIVKKQSAEGKTILFSSHQMSQVEEFCEEICIINKGEKVLEGRIDDIKRSYPRNIYYVSVGGFAADEFLTAVMRQMGSWCKGIRRKGPGFEVALVEPSARGMLFDAIRQQGLTPEVFTVKEPTLEEIFVEKAGGSDETGEEN
jgi:ABC-2 type transport system ATP-binding protein